MCDSHLSHLVQWWRRRESGRLRVKREPKRKLNSPDAMSCGITSLFMHLVEENYTISNEGVNEVDEKLSYMTVCV